MAGVDYSKWDKMDLDADLDGDTPMEPAAAGT